MKKFFCSIFDKVKSFIKRNSSEIENLFWNFINGLIDIRKSEIRSN